MKINRMILTLLLGFSLLTTSALACDNSGQARSQESHWSFSFTSWCHRIADSHRECDHDGQNTGQGNNCDRGKGNGGGYCSATGGSTSSGGSSTTAGGGKGVSN